MFTYVLLFFFFNQKTAYEMRISDWSSDVCSSDLLDAMDRRYLSMIATTYKGGPVGVETLAAGLAEPRDTVEDVIEPYLIQLGLLARTARGRVLNDAGWGHLEMSPPKPKDGGPQGALFDEGK